MSFAVARPSLAEVTRVNLVGVRFGFGGDVGDGMVPMSSGTVSQVHPGATQTSSPLPFEAPGAAG